MPACTPTHHTCQQAPAAYPTMLLWQHPCLHGRSRPQHMMHTRCSWIAATTGMHMPCAHGGCCTGCRKGCSDWCFWHTVGCSGPREPAAAWPLLCAHQRLHHCLSQVVCGYYTPWHAQAIARRNHWLPWSACHKAVRCSGQVQQGGVSQAAQGWQP